MTLEFASSSDGKEAITQAANVLFMKHLKFSENGVEQEEQVFTEAQMDEALNALGLSNFLDWLNGSEIDFFSNDFTIDVIDALMQSGYKGSEPYLQNPICY
ncbi:hypothetical protein P3X46_032713 [Hevea brasiliensis]|uniref:ditrans,polycis-polyprenyl diphosphate synthase [(2E,6E)-farnesyldiphosphate specific] n=1 Tax=Hevea brasiliensis TaxID=3981 RepID=A0ABQ9KE43_HEVBR|nr:hypothetical protein P3X46_032713 [Hevea brasiliensis]